MRRYKAAPLTCEQQDALAMRAKAGDMEARNRLVASIVRLIAKQAWAISKPDEDVEDYVQEAVVKILENVHRYDPKRGHFTTFMLPWASGGRHIWKHKQGWQRAYRNGRTFFVSMDAPVSGDAPLTVAGVIPAEPDTSIETKKVSKVVRSRLDSAGLSNQERCVLDLALALDLDTGFQTKCAELMGVSRERIGQLWTGRGVTSTGVLGKLKVALADLAFEVV